MRTFEHAFLFTHHVGRTISSSKSKALPFLRSLPLLPLASAAAVAAVVAAVVATVAAGVAAVVL